MTHAPLCYNAWFDLLLRRAVPWRHRLHISTPHYCFRDGESNIALLFYTARTYMNSLPMRPRGDITCIPTQASMDRPCFTTLPAEILEAIFLHLDPASLVSVSQTNKHIHHLTDDAPLLWRHYCRTRFSTWDSRHRIADKLAGPLSDVDWRALYKSRLNIERRTSFLLHRIVATQHERVQHITEIADFGYDAKETLLRERACSDEIENVLAVRFYANAILERIQREFAINVWKDVLDEKNVPIETALGAYDMFAGVREDAHVDDVAQDLDRRAQGVLHDYPKFGTMSTREKATTIITYLRDNGFQGVPDESYHALPNSFIAIAMRSQSHESLPLVSVAIFCAVARRLGVDARPCGFRFHVYALVYAPKDYNLNGKYTPTSFEYCDCMYVDPFRSSEEVHRVDLKRLLSEMGVPSAEHAQYLGDTDTREMVLRCAKNIMNSVQNVRQVEAGLPRPTAIWLHTKPDSDNAFYAAIWALIILAPADNPDESSILARRQQFLPYLLEHFNLHYPWDITLLSRYVIPLFRNQPAGLRLLQFVQSRDRDDKIRKTPVRRNERTKNVKFKVGQLFQHERYGYEGIITGWNATCDADEAWCQSMGVDDLSDGRHQAFYHVLVADKSVRYVAEENIAPAPPRHATPMKGVMLLAGRHFKRWDKESGCFISNIRDEYPDD